MLETVDLNAKLAKDEAKTALTELDTELGRLQRDLKTANVPVIVIFEGWDASGKGSVLSRLLQAFDPRGFKVHNIAAPTDEEHLYPPMHRFWNLLPARGTMAFYNRSWYRQVMDERVEGGMEGAGLLHAFERIRVFERQLADDGAVIVKLFFHISQKEQARRFKRLSEDPAFSWKVGKVERARHKRYGEYFAAVEDMLQATSTPYAPWTLIPSTDDRFACVRVAEALTAAFQQAARVHETGEPAVAASSLPGSTRHETSPLARVNLGLAVSREDYDKRLPKLQAELRRLQHLCYVHRTPVLVLYEGWDAAGKGGNIRRLVRELDPRGYEVVPVAAPQGDEKTHHYLWRFWRALPKAGHISIFDRTWYGRVLVERIEGYARPCEWGRAYREINEFEAELADYGAAIIKFWLHISKEEQLARFEARQNTPDKMWKITEEDWRNRERWDSYWAAITDMVERTSTVHAPWTIVEANDKYHARVKALETVIKRIKTVIGEK